MNFSSLYRPQIIKKLQNTSFDLLVIGGGITGAGIALDASVRGLKVALVEKYDFAEGTSSRSTKLVHGGLRYLKNAELKLVKDTGRERHILYKNAAHIVYPKTMFLPIYRDNKYGLLLTSLAIGIYDRLAGVRPKYRKKTWLKKRVLKHLPILKSKGLKGAIRYYEYRTNDARLVIENLKKATEYGLTALNSCSLEDFIYQNNTISGVVLKDTLTAQKFSIKAQYVINATGAWVDKIRAVDGYKGAPILLPSKGVHIVVDKSKLPLNDAVYFELPDQRMIFAIPTWNKVYVGTTDTLYNGDIEQVCSEKEDVDYLLKALQRYFQITLTEKDVEITWAGIRPLVNKKAKDIGKVSRKEELIVDKSGLISITGGKLTAYRLMAKKTVDKVFSLMKEESGKDFIACTTEKIPLAGAEFDFDVEQYLLVEYVEKLFYLSHQLKANTQLINQLFYTYGKNLELIIDKAYDIYNDANIEQRRFVWLEAEIWYTVNYEMVVHLSDFLVRRTEKHIFYYKETQQYLDFIIKIMGHYLNWTEEQKQEEKRIYQKMNI